MINAAFDNREEYHSQHRRLNYDICSVLDSNKFRIVLDDMVKAGMNPKLEDIYRAQFDALRAMLRSENNRLWYD